MTEWLQQRERSYQSPALTSLDSPDGIGQPIPADPWVFNFVKAFDNFQLEPSAITNNIATTAAPGLQPPLSPFYNDLSSPPGVIPPIPTGERRPSNELLAACAGDALDSWLLPATPINDNSNRPVILGVHNTPTMGPTIDPLHVLFGNHEMASSPCCPIERDSSDQPLQAPPFSFLNNVFEPTNQLESWFEAQGLLDSKLFDECIVNRNALNEIDENELLFRLGQCSIANSGNSPLFESSLLEAVKNMSDDNSFLANNNNNNLASDEDTTAAATTTATAATTDTTTDITEETNDETSEPAYTSVTPAKLFVNRVPKTVKDDELKVLFEPYGTVLECNILKNNMGPKGCAFVKYATVADAKRAIDNLHGKHVLNEDAGAMQIKFADGEISRLGLSLDVQPGGESVKVFVGCLPRRCDESDLVELFSLYGRVDEVYMLRDQQKQPKCSAFVTYTRMDSAKRAIMELDKKFSFPNSKRPLEVRLAESKASRYAKEKKRLLAAAAAAHQQQQYEEGSSNNNTPVDDVATNTTTDSTTRQSSASENNNNNNSKRRNNRRWARRQRPNKKRPPLGI